MVDKITDETAGVAIEKFVVLKPKIYPYLVNDNSKHKNAKVAKGNVVATISHNEHIFCWIKNVTFDKYVPMK